MGISAYQIENVIKAYNKQSNARLCLDIKSAPSQGRYTDMVTLSGNAADMYNKISYNLLDVVLKGKKVFSL
jgi:hypothetical protein